MAVAISVIVALMIRRMTRPMANLAAAAERLGRGETVPPVPERGPEDVRQTTRAFNRIAIRGGALRVSTRYVLLELCTHVWAEGLGGNRPRCPQ